jgi:hypothetical protein
MMPLIQRASGQRAKRHNLHEVDRREHFRGWTTHDLAFDVNMYHIAAGTDFLGAPARAEARWDWYITSRDAPMGADLMLKGQAPTPEIALCMAAVALNDGTVDAIVRRKKLAGTEW